MPSTRMRGAHSGYKSGRVPPTELELVNDSDDLESGQQEFLPPSPLRGNVERLNRARLMSSETVGDLIDFILELAWYRRPDRLAALEKEHTTMAVTLLVLAWYASAIFAITTSKKIMLVLPMPYTLCASQFTTATIVTLLMSQYYNYGGLGGTSSSDSRRGGGGSKGSKSSIDTVAGSTMSERKKQLPGSVVSNGNGNGAGGLGMSSGSSMSGSSSNNNNISSIEAPMLRSVVLAGSKEGENAKAPFDSLRDIGVFGVFTLPPSHLYTKLLFMTALSYTCGFLFTNMAFSVVTASFAETVKSGEPISSVIFCWFILGEKSSTTTYLTLIPICVGVALSCFHDNSFNPLGFFCAAASNIMFSLRAVLAKKLVKTYPGATDDTTMFGHVSLIGLCMLIPLALYIEGPALVDHFLLELDASYVSSRHELLFVLLCNTLAYTSYNLMSFFVLRRTTMVTHAVLNCFRRVFIIVFTCNYFQVPISNFNLVGIGVAVTGVIAFGWSKTIGTKGD